MLTSFTTIHSFPFLSAIAPFRQLTRLSRCQAEINDHSCGACSQYTKERFTTPVGAEVECRTCGCPHSDQRASGLPFLCVLCEDVLPAGDDVSFFQLFGLPETFDLDIDALNKRYRDLQKIVHPDLRTGLGRTGGQQQRAAEGSVMLTTARETLRDPEQRALYILSRRGYDVTSPSAVSAVEPEFLAKMMDLQEQVASAVGPTLDALRREVAQGTKEASDRVGVLISTERNEEAFKAAMELRYWGQVGRAIAERTP